MFFLFASFSIQKRCNSFYSKDLANSIHAKNYNSDTESKELNGLENKKAFQKSCLCLMVLKNGQTFG